MFAKTKILPATSRHCVVFDLDDTLAKYCKQRRLPGCHEFDPIPTVLNAILEIQGNGTDTVIASARPVWTLEKTLLWMKSHALSSNAIYLRSRGTDDVPPHEVKRQMLLDIQKDWHISAFWDDSPYNCSMAESLGIPTVLVPGNEIYWQERGARSGWTLPVRP